MIPLQCKQSTRVSRDYFKMRFDLSERIIWAGPNTMIYFHYTWKKNNYCRIHHLWIRQSVLNVDNVIVIAALLYNNLAMTSPYWCPPSRLCLYIKMCVNKNDKNILRHVTLTDRLSFQPRFPKMWTNIQEANGSPTAPNIARTITYLIANPGTSL